MSRRWDLKLQSFCRIENVEAQKVSYFRSFGFGIPDDGRVNFLWLPKPASFHAAGYDQSLAGDVAGEEIGGKEDGCVSDVVGPGELRERHGGGDLADDVCRAEFVFKSRDKGPAGANAIEASAAIVGSVRREAADFVL